MENRVFQAVRLLVTLGIGILVIKGTNVRMQGGGLTDVEFINYGRAALMVAIAGIGVSVLWSGSLCDGLAGVLMALTDDPDNRPIKENPMDKLNRLARTGRIKRARRLCRPMIRRGEGSRMALETLLVHLDDRQGRRLVLGSGSKRISGGK